MKNTYTEAYRSFDWDDSIMPNFDHKKVMALGLIFAGIIMAFIALNIDSDLLNGPYGWWPILPFITIFVFIGFAFLNFKCRLCGHRIKFLQIRYQKDLEPVLLQSRYSGKYAKSEWSDCFLQVYVCEKCMKQALGGINHKNEE